MPARQNRLVTIVFSHYNEKARWALDVCGVDYTEQRLMPFFSYFGVLLATRGKGGRADAVSSRFSTPLLVTAEGETLSDSTDIAHWASARIGGGGPGPLFPTPEVDELVARFGRVLGPSTRLVAYWHALKSETALKTLADENVGPVQALAFKALAPLGKQLIGRGLGVTDSRKERATAKVMGEIAFVEERLAKQRFLVGDTFTAADLTFASLFAPALLVTREEGYGASLCGLDDIAQAGKDLVRDMRATRAGQFALEMFAHHRHARLEPARAASR